MSLEISLGVRLTHFFNFRFLSLLVRSGIEILGAHPKRYWPDHCTPGTEWLRFTRNKLPDDAVDRGGPTAAEPRGLRAPGRVRVRGSQVEHITRAKPSTPHRMTAFAEVDGTRIMYPGDNSEGGRLATRAPFHLQATVRVLQRRPTNLVDIWEQERYLRVLATTDGLALVEVANHGTIDDPDVRFAILRGEVPGATRATLGEILHKVLGLDVDPTPLQRLADAEPRLAPTALALRGMRPPRFVGLFEAFANVVPFQQVSLPAGVAIVGRLVERFGTLLEHDGRSFHAFPTAEAVAQARLDALRRCGLSPRKAEALRHIARAIGSGELSEDKLKRMTSAEAIRSLTELPGIGPWSAELVLLRGLGRLDVFPPGDVGVARGLSRLMRLPPGPLLNRVVQRFGDHRGYLYFYSLGGALLAQRLIDAAPPPPRRRRPAIRPG